MNKQQIYNIFGFIMSLYLLILTIVSLLKISLPYHKQLEMVGYVMLLIFIVELIWVFTTYSNKRDFFIKEWVSITAISVSVSFAGIFYFFADWGFVGAAKVAKALKGFDKTWLAKASKIGKSSKVVKTAKSYKKVAKE